MWIVRFPEYTMHFILLLVDYYIFQSSIYFHILKSEGTGGDLKIEKLTNRNMGEKNKH